VGYAGYLGLAHYDAWPGDVYINPSTSFLAFLLISQKLCSFSPKPWAAESMCALPLLFQKYTCPLHVRSSPTFPRITPECAMCAHLQLFQRWKEACSMCALRWLFPKLTRRQLHVRFFPQFSNKHIWGLYVRSPRRRKSKS